MNKQEYWKLPNRRSTYEYKFTHKLLKQWKADNNCTCRCIIHHRDDTEETRKYNEEHYERWGIDENGEFEEGKYVQFMTISEHMGYHNSQRDMTGKNNPMYGRTGKDSPFYGKHHTEETRAKQSAAKMGEKNPRYWEGKNLLEVARAKLSENRRTAKEQYDAYKAHGINITWNDFQHALKNGELQPISVYTNGGN